MVNAKIRSVRSSTAFLQGYEDEGALWRCKFESDTFISDMDELWEQIEPLYSELHTYVSRKLKERYGDKLDIEDGLIPAHVFGKVVLLAAYLIYLYFHTTVKSKGNTEF